jgi:hypothetical protein
MPISSNHVVVFCLGEDDYRVCQLAKIIKKGEGNILPLSTLHLTLCRDCVGWFKWL